MGTLRISLEPKWCIPLVWMEEEYISHQKETAKQSLSAGAPGGGSLYDPHWNVYSKLGEANIYFWRDRNNS